MALEILPIALHAMPNCERLLKSQQSALFHKTLSASLVDKKMYLSSAAIVFVSKGQQRIRNYDASPITVAENEIVILPKDLYVVSDFVTEVNSFEAYIAFIDDDLIKKFLQFYPLSEINELPDNQIHTIPARSVMRDYISSVLSIYPTKTTTSALHEVKLIEFLLLLADETNKNAFRALTQTVKKRAIKQFMADNYLARLNVSDFASLTGRSPSTFNREFNKIYGTSPKKWLTKMRLEKSKDLLCKGSMNVTEVSMEVGYENVSHFINAYKKRYGVTPKHHIPALDD